ncbi:MAG: aminodeoxychorismate synthase component I [Acidimicrobiia bacterium]|nr:aminodeoxychorismate synthase component I [Acidimicrobiia bacterium]
MPAPIRFDDLNSELSFELTHCVAEFSAMHLDDVRAVIQAAEGAASEGYWAAGYVSYEAAPAFDDALQVRKRAIGDPYEELPLAWFGIYRDRLAVDPLRRRESGPSGYGLSAWAPSVTEDEYRIAIEDIHEAIARGDTYQVNHTFRMRAAFSGDAAELYRDLIVAQRGEYGAFIDTGRFQILSASPERFFRLQGRHIDVRPMKGTARRGRWTGEDEALAAELQASEKNRAENVMIVDLLRNDLGRVAEFGSVNVEELFELERYETLWQLTSQIGADIGPDVDLPAVFDALFPSGSVTGAPKASTMNLIRNLESTPRGVYCGAIGFVAPEGHDAGAHFNVAIRTVVIDREANMAEYGTGGGITWDSSHGSEYEEALLKARVLHSGKERFTLLETLRWEDGGYLLLDRHLDRLADSAEYFGFAYSEDAVRKALESDAPSAESARVRLQLSRRGGLTVEAPEIDLLPFVDDPTDLAFGLHQVHVTMAEAPVDSSDISLFHKTSRRDIYDRARSEAPGVDDVLLWNLLGNVTESTIANVALRFEDVWITPHLESGLLAGVYRAELLERGVLEEAPVPIADLERADEIALINSVRGWRRAVVVPRAGFTGRH